MSRNDKLFNTKELSDRFSVIFESVGNRVMQITKESLKTASVEKLNNEIYEEMKISPLKLYLDKQDVESLEVEIDLNKNRLIQKKAQYKPSYVQGIGMKLVIPFSGDDFLWIHKPSKWSTTFPFGEIKKTVPDNLDYIQIYYEQRVNEPIERIKGFFDSQVKLIKEYIEYQRDDIEKFNDRLKVKITVEINKRKGNLSIHEQALEILGIPLKAKEEAPNIEPIKLERRVVKPSTESKKAEEIKNEYGIYEADYEHILSVIRHEGSTFESMPETLKSHGEEDLRTFILAHLNGHYEGNATGETFRNSGKTDIRIEFENRAAFVGECKLWTGKNGLSSAIDQLLGYLVWRDCKASIIVFNKKNKSFSGILKQIPSILKSHPLLQDIVYEKNGNEWRALFKSNHDENRFITIHFFIFNLYCAE